MSAADVSEPVGAPESAEPSPEHQRAAKAAAWLDVALTELSGALNECAACVEQGTMDPALISSKIHQLVMRFAGL